MWLNKKLSPWQQAGLIDEHIIQNVEYERSSSKLVLWAAGGLRL